MDTVKIDSQSFRADTIPTPHATLLVIQGSKGMLGCGYLSLETAEKMKDALAIVTGVSSYEDMLKASVKKVSIEAVKLGVQPGMTGEEALLKMK